MNPLNFLRARLQAVATTAAAATVLALMPNGAVAQAPWPSRPIKLIVPFAPGGGSDIMGRAVAMKLSARLGQQVIVENKTGAGGTLAFDAAAKAPPDGYTLLFMTTAFATVASTGQKLPFDPVKDLVPIGQVGATPLVVVVAKDSPYKTLRDLLDAARAKPNAISYGSSGIGSMSHLGMEFLSAESKTQMLHVPYKGIAPAFTDLLGGNLQAAISTFASATPLFDSGKLRGLVVTSAQRTSFAPDMPTSAEAGLPGFRIDFWWGLMAPARLPSDLVKRLNDELNAALNQPDMRELLAREAAVPITGTPGDFGKLVASDIALWTRLIRTHNIKAE